MARPSYGDEGVIGLKLEADTSQATRAQKALADVKAAQEKLNAEFDAGKVRGADFARQMTSLNSAARTLEAQIRTSASAMAAMGDATAAGAEKASKGAANLGRTFMETGRIAQDFAQGGVGGIINNLEGFARALGQGPGIAGVATLAGVAFLLAKPYLKGFLDSLDTSKLQDFRGEIDKLQDHIKTLTEKPGPRLWIDSQELDIAERKLDKLQKGLAAFRALEARRTEAEQQSGKEFGEAITNAPGGAEAVGDKLRAQREKEIRAKDPARAEAESRLAEAATKRDAAQAKVDAGTATVRDFMDLDEAKKSFDQLWAAVRQAGGAIKEQAKAEVGGMIDQAMTGRGQAEVVGLMKRAGVDGNTVYEAENAGADRVKARKSAAEKTKADESLRKASLDSERDARKRDEADRKAFASEAFAGADELQQRQDAEKKKRADDADRARHVQRDEEEKARKQAETAAERSKRAALASRDKRVNALSPAYDEPFRAAVEAGQRIGLSPEQAHARAQAMMAEDISGRGLAKSPLEARVVAKALAAKLAGKDAIDDAEAMLDPEAAMRQLQAGARRNLALQKTGGFRSVGLGPGVAGMARGLTSPGAIASRDSDASKLGDLAREIPSLREEVRSLAETMRSGVNLRLAP